MSNKAERMQSVNTPITIKQEGISVNALKMAFGTFASRILGLLRECLLAALFDKTTTDAWSAAFRIPNLFRRLLGEGALAVSFIPQFIEAHNDNTKRAQNLVNGFYTLLLLFTGVITAMGILFPQSYLQIILDPSYVSQTEKYQQTVLMAQIMFGFVFCVTHYAFFMGLLNALGQFFWPAFAPLFFNVVLVISTLLPKSMLGQKAAILNLHLAWGVLIGGLLQVAVLLPTLSRTEFFPTLSLLFKNLDLKKVLKNFIPGVIGAGLLQFLTLVNLHFSSALPEGSISYLNYVDRLVELPLTLIAVSLGSALLPALSKLWINSDKKKFVEKSMHYLSFNLFISISAASGLFVLSEPIVRLLFGRGQFLEKDILQTALILKSYCGIMIFMSGIRVLIPAYYAVKNTWFPGGLMCLCLGLHFLCAPFFVQWAQIQGLMWSSLLFAALNFTGLLLFFSVYISKFDVKNFLYNLTVSVILGLLVYALSSSYFILSKVVPVWLSLMMVMTGVVCLVLYASFKNYPAEFIWLKNLKQSLNKN